MLFDKKMFAFFAHISLVRDYRVLRIAVEKRFDPQLADLALFLIQLTASLVKSSRSPIRSSRG